MNRELTQADLDLIDHQLGTVRYEQAEREGSFLYGFMVALPLSLIGWLLIFKAAGVL